VDQLVFPTVQTYSGGEVVNWTDAPKADGSEPQHPAPVLKLVAAATDSAGNGHSDPASATPVATPSVAAMKDTSPTAASGSDGTARILGALGIVVGLLGAGIGVAGLRRSRG
jgi:hypothetical protein